VQRGTGGRRGSRAALVAAVCAALVGLVTVPGRTTAQSGSFTVTAQPATGVGLDVNWTPFPGAAGYQLKASDNAGLLGPVVTASCWGCTHHVIRGGLQVLHLYTVSVTPVNAAGTPIGAAATTLSATYFDLPPPPLASLTATEIGTTQTLRVQWAYSTLGMGADRLLLQLNLVQANGALSPVSGITVFRNVEPNEYVIPVPPGRWAIRAIPVNAAGFAAATVTPPVTVTNSCGDVDLCVRVGTEGARPVRLLGQGFQHGLPSTNTAEIAPLEPKLWRIVGQSADTEARALGGQRMQVLSDLWFHRTSPSNGGYAATPWSNWTAWRDFVRNTVARARAEGWSPDYWDVWNEPNGACCPPFSPAARGTQTADLWLQTYEEAWRAIKAADPSARIVGPSTSALQWTNELWPDPKPELDLDRFLAHSRTRGLVWDAVTWHENYLQPTGGDISYSIVNVARHFERARAVMARHPGTVADDRIIVDEYGPLEAHPLAGWAVGYFRQFEDAGVQANRTCWNMFECTAGLNGLFAPSGEPTALYWTHRAYADLDGGSPMAVSSSAPWQFDGLANRDDATRTVRALLGRHWYCNAPVNPWCQHDLGVTAASARATLQWPYGTEPVTVTVTRMPAGDGVVSAPLPVSSATMTPVSGELAIPLPAVADGDAFSIVAQLAVPTPAPSTTTPSSTTIPPSSTTTTVPPNPPATAGAAPVLTPGTVTATAGRSSITLSWAAAKPNGAPVTGYIAACSTPGLPAQFVTATGSALSATLTGLQWWRPYSCAVAATNQFGTSQPVMSTPATLRPRLL
jgi:hypothetical protein